MATAEHQEAVRRFNDWAGDGAKITTWTSSNPKADWPESMEHLEKDARPVRTRRSSER
jgi:hypothetical protein